MPDPSSVTASVANAPSSADGPLFLSAHEKALVQDLCKQDLGRGFFWTLLNRTSRRAATTELTDASVDAVEWWHCASEYLTDAAMAHALKPDAQLALWLRTQTLAIARRPIGDWVGPDFRDHDTRPPVGYLETAHLSWALAVVLDLAGQIFTEAERDEVAAALREKGIALCRRWLERAHTLTNWRCILLAGVAVPAAVLNLDEDIVFAAGLFPACADAFQLDGSYGESLQYGNYAMTGLVYTREALVRRRPDLGALLPLEPYVRKPRWDVAALMYARPLSGWGAYAWPRSVNFGDSAAVYRASADNLLHIAARARESLPVEAGLARWLFEQCYVPCLDRAPRDRASFGFVNDFGFLTLSLLAQAAPALSPQEAGLEPLQTFDCGDIIARDGWSGRTTLAMRSGTASLHAVAHHHGDLNTFILAHNGERLLADPGHSCYRGLIHGVETATRTHNTCYFTEDGAEDTVTRMIEQRGMPRREICEDGGNGQPVEPLARLLLAASHGDVRMIVSEAGMAYGSPVSAFKRFWVLCGGQALFVVDHVRAERPVRAHWSWLLNNRDDTLDLKIVRPDRLVARRGAAGMKLFHLGGGTLEGPLYSYMHDAYHPLPARHGEGKSGSGLLVRWHAAQPQRESLTVHAICLDDPGSVAGWHLYLPDDGTTLLESPGGGERWALQMDDDGGALTVTETNSGQGVRAAPVCDGSWQLTDCCV